MNLFKRIVFLSLMAFVFSNTISAISVSARHKEKPQNTIVQDKNPTVDAKSKASTVAVKHYLLGDFKTPMDKMSNWPVERIDKQGTLLFSDSPETVPDDGILYEDVVKGNGRLYYYHVNGTSDDKKVVVMLTNESLKNDVDFHITRSTQVGPSIDYLDVGKNSQLNYFGYQSPRHIFINKNSRQILENRTNRMLIRTNELVCGIYDFTTQNPVKITVMMLPIDADPYEFIKTASVLPKDTSRLRGTFKNMDRILQSTKIYNPQQNGAVYFTVADDSDDTYLTGIDATDGSSVKNYGNYGVLYYINIPTSGMGNIHYYLQPLGGIYAGAVAVQVNDSPNSTVLPTPSESCFFGENTYQNYYADLGIYKTRDSVLFQYSPPGASNLPIRIIIAPE